jgi:hypothetical protein
MEKARLQECVLQKNFEVDEHVDGNDFSNV